MSPWLREADVVKAEASGAIYAQYSALIDGPCIGFVADHESKLLIGLGDAVDWATVTRLGPPKTVIVGKMVRS